MGQINLIDPEGIPRTFDEQDPAVRDAIAAGWTIEAPEAAAARTIGSRVQADYSGLGDKVVAGAAGVARGLTFGGSDALARLIDDDLAYDLARTREANPGISTAGELTGAIAPALLTGGESLLGTAARFTPAGATARLGAAIARTGEEAGALTRLGRATAGGFVEGGLYSTGEGISDLALSDDPLSVERIAGSLSHRFIYGGATGGLATGAIGGLELGLGAARRRLTAAKDATSVIDGIPEDLAALDRKGLRAAEEAELGAIEAGRVPQRQAVADDLTRFREQTKIDQPWVAVATGSKADAIAAKKLTAKAAKAEAKAVELEAVAQRTADAADVEMARAARTAADEAADVAATASAGLSAGKAPRWMREQGKLAMEADRSLDRILRNPKALAERPQLARAALQQQEHALEQIAARADELKAMHATDTTGRRAAALEKVGATLEANRALQDRIVQLGAKPASERLTAITNAVDALGATRAKTLGEQMAGGAAYGMAADLVRSVPVVGPMLAPLVGARVADAVSGKLGGQLAAVTRVAKERAVKAIDAFLTVTAGAKRLAPKVVPVLSSKVLEAVRFGPEAPPANDERGRRRKPTIEDHFDARAAELGAAVAPGPDGRPKVRPHVRQQIADRLAPLAGLAPHVADKAESHAVRKLEFLAGKMPRATQIGMTRMRPDDFAIRAWAHYIAAAEDPDAIAERLNDGTVTHEDAEVMRELYPERLADIVRQIATRLGELRESLPYERRLALSILTGAAVDASTDPRILAALQASFVDEPGTAGGTQAPHPQPAFGSVAKPEPTPAQRRAAGG